MEVAILQPHDCLKRHHQYNHHNRRPLLTKPNPNPNPNPNRSNRRRRNSPPPPQPQQTRPRSPRSPPVSGQFRILKRGEDLSLSLPPPITTTKKPEPEKEKSRSFSGPIRVDGFYAGSAFVTSPPPSEVPLPAFFTRRSCGGESQNDEIACELRKVLKLQV